MRVYELAKELGITYRDLVPKIRAMGFPVNNHMSFVETDSADRIREAIERERQEGVEETQVNRTVFRRRQKTAPPAQPAVAPSVATPIEARRPEPREFLVETPVTPRVQAHVQETLPIAHEASGAVPAAPPSLISEQAPATTAPPMEETPAPAEAKREPTTTLPVKDDKAASTAVHDAQAPAEEPKAEPEPSIVPDATQVQAPVPAQEQEIALPARKEIQAAVPPTPSAPPREAQAKPQERVQPPVSTSEQRASVAAPRTDTGPRPPAHPKRTGPSQAARGQQQPPAAQTQDQRRGPGGRPRQPMPGHPGATAPGGAPGAPQRRPERGGERPPQGAQARPTDTQAVIISKPNAEEIATRVREGMQDRALQAKRDTERRTRTKSSKETITKQDLYGDSERFGGGLGRKRKAAAAKRGSKPQITTPKAIKRVIRMQEGISVGELSKQMGIKASDVIRKLMGLGTMVSINQVIDIETAGLIASEFGYEVENVAFQEANAIRSTSDRPEDLKNRAPVVTIMGHVDHGKTSLLDKIRHANVAGGEHGGITQHIGAYNVKLPGGNIVFLDTPGHEAFTSMRARGANCTDIVILVVAADDGVMPQTIEAINHAKEAGVPIVVAVNKMDVSGANLDRVTNALSEFGLIPESWGGDTMFAPVSAKTGDGIDDLLESILVQTELMELKANPAKRALGVVLEAKVETGRGTVATVLVKEGTLKVGDPIVASTAYGKVRAMNDDLGRQVTSAGPSSPVEVIGLSGVPEAGDILTAVEEERDAKNIAEHRGLKAREAEMTKRAATKTDLASLFGTGTLKELKVIIKGDVQGSVEAVREALLKLSSDRVKLGVIHSGVGSVTESDVMLASAAHKDSADTAVMVVAFNIRANPKVLDLANSENVDIRPFTVIYDVVDEVKKAMSGLLAPTLKEKYLGRAEVRQTFSVPKIGTVAGCMITDGKIFRNSKIRLLRNEVQIHDGRVSSLRRFKNDVKEVVSGFECGIGIENYNDIHLGDIIESYEILEVAATL